MTDALTLDAIPHRPPFLFVDEIVELSQDRIVTTKRTDGSEEFYQGHYPGKPIMPGVLICEACFQAGALLIASRIGSIAASEGVPVVTRISDVRFKRIVKPGDTLCVEASLDEEIDNAYYLTARATVDGKLAARVSFACMQTSDEGPTS